MFPRYNMKCILKHDTIHEIFRIVSRFPPLHFMLYRGKSISFGTVHGRLLFRPPTLSKHIYIYQLAFIELKSLRYNIFGLFFFTDS